MVDLVGHDHSFGGLPGTGVVDAVEAACRAINEGAAYYLRSDVKSFFAQIPRERALAELTAVLEDDSLDNFLEEATRTELANREDLGHLLEFFPDDVTGVPQGHSLSALLGNVLLREFDDRLNEGECVCLRYLDDFLILGPDREAVWKTFRQGREVLAAEGLEAYDPHESEKAQEGSSRSFEFLGCHISHGFVHPSRANRTRLLDRIRTRLETSKRVMMSGGFGSSSIRSQSLVATLHEISQILEAWSKHYQFCNAANLMAELDAQVDEMLRDYIGAYTNQAGRASQKGRRRMLGVWKLADTDLDPILPLEEG